MIAIFTSLMPVALLIALGFIVAKLGIVTELGAQDLTRLTFNVLAPALLFHTMTLVHINELDVQPIFLYFVVALSLFACSILVRGFSRKSTVLGLAVTYSNTTMIGVPLVGLVYGSSGLVYLFTLISVHAIVLLTVATIALELSLIHENSKFYKNESKNYSIPWKTIGKALRKAIIHPVPIPIIFGVIFSYLGWDMPRLIEQPLVWVGQAFSPLALLLVGMSLYFAMLGVPKISQTQYLNIENVDESLIPAGQHENKFAELLPFWKVATTLTFIKNIVNPLLVLLVGYLIGVKGLALSVMVLTASLPIGANVFLFSQRYRSSQPEITIAVSMSTVAALTTVPFIMWLSQLIQ